MKKIILTMCFLFCFCFASLNIQAATIKSNLVVNDNLYVTDSVDLRIVNGITFLSLKDFSQVTGITYNNADTYVSLKKDNTYVEVQKSAKAVLVHKNTSKQIDSLLNSKGELLIPLREIASIFGYSLSYVSEGPFIRLVNTNVSIPNNELYNSFRSQLPKTNVKTIYLTFDDGPNKYTPQLLDILKKNNVQGTFFLLNDSIKNNKEVVKRMAQEGHSIGLHGVTHDYKKFYGTATSAVNEMNQANDTLQGVLGYRTDLVRTPYGSSPYLTKSQYTNLSNAGYKIWDWHVDSLDWKYKDYSQTYNTVIKQIKAFNTKDIVVLFHDRDNTLKVVPDVIAWGKANGYEFKALTGDMSAYHFAKY